MPAPAQDYIRHKLPLTGGLNIDAASLVPDDDFVELHNLRKSHADGYELRSGHATYLSAFEGYPQYKAEYVVFNDAANIRYKYDATVYNRKVSAGVYEVRVQFLDKETKAISDDVLVAGTFSEEQVICCGQSQFALLVSIFGYNTYIVYPTAFTPRPSAFAVKTLLPEPSDAPITYSFVKDTEGDLVLQEHDINALAEHDPWGFTTESSTSTRTIMGPRRSYKPFTETTEPNEFVNGNKRRRVRIPLKAPYYLRDQTPDLFPGCPLARWVFAPEDTNPTSPNNVKQATTHLQTQGWIYRAIYVYRFTDANGNNYEYRASGSTDFWVPDMIYCPPQLFVKRSGVLSSDRPKVLRGVSHTTGNNYRSYYDGYDDGNGGDTNFDDSGFNADGTAVPFPSKEAMKKLLDRMIEYYAVDKSSDTYTQAAATGGGPFWDNNSTIFPNGGNTAIYWAAWWAGFRTINNTDFSADKAFPPSVTNFTGETPWWCEVPASYLKGAPMVKFSWNDFPDRPGLVAVELYRTAYNCPSSADNVKWSPDFGEHDFQFVGSLSKVEGDNSNNYFIDDVPDDERDPGKNPEDYDGYISNQLTAQVYTEYNSQGVLGNLKTKNWTLGPAPQVPNGRAVFYNPIDGAAGVDHTTYSGLWTIALQYVDIDGYKSATHLARIEQSGLSALVDWHIAVTMPTGYAPSVTRINVYYIKYASFLDLANALAGGDVTAGATDFRFIESVSASQRYYFIKSSAGWQTVSPDVLGEDIHTTTQPGAIVKSKPFQMFQWDPINTEIMHQNKPVTVMEVIAGRLWVLTDGSIHLTEANGERQEPENNRIGCIGRHCGVKVDKVVYFLSGDGLYYTEASGPVKLPIKIQNLILPYLQEQVAGELPLRNAARAAIGYNGQRNELWLHIPASGVDGDSALAGRASRNYLGSPLPQRTIIIRLNDSYMPQNADAYTFDLAAQTAELDSYEIGDTDRVLPVIFGSHSDGTLWVSYGPLAGSIKETKLITLNADDPSQVWRGESVLCKAIILRDPQAVKVLRKVDLTFQARSSFDITTGIADTTGAWTPGKGYLSPATTTYLFTLDSPTGGGFVTRSHEPPGANENSVGKILYVRLRSRPSPTGNHEVKYKDMGVYIAARHIHV